MRNREAIVQAAREAFAEQGAATSLEAIARRAGVGIGTLYRHFPSRPELLEAVYREEVEELGRSMTTLEGAEPWTAFRTWMHRLVGYLIAKQALAAELLQYMDRDSPLFSVCRATLQDASRPLLARAQAAGVVRGDVDMDEVVAMAGGIARIPGGDPERIAHILDIALDGLRRGPRP
jgi:AcrR family transcriptional regulator